jgi:hypothetical protein
LFAVSSLGNRMIFSLTSCPEMVPDPAFFGDCIRASIAEAEAAATAVEKPPLRRAKRTATTPRTSPARRPRATAAE